MRPYLYLSLARLNIYMKSTVVAKVPAAAYFAFVCCSALDGTCKIHLILAHIYHTIFENKLHQGLTFMLIGVLKKVCLTHFVSKHTAHAQRNEATVH